MSYKYYPITGIKAGWGPNGKLPLRQNIDEWYQKEENKAQVVLFLLALKRLQDMPPDQRDSFFQIAGIHGMPFKSWDEPSTTQAEVGKKGYCTHANYLFPPWHRPYLLLYEQRLYDIMINEIIPEYPEGERASSRAAADSWRLPYWDWATNPKIPWLAAVPQLYVTPPGLPKVKMDNPLYQFAMPNSKNMASEGVGDVKLMGEDTILSYGNCVKTSRCPEESETAASSRAWIDGVVRNEKVTEFMAAKNSVDGEIYGAAAEMVYRLLTYPLGYSQFATMAIDEDPRVETDVNIEFIHNNIHYWAGGDGGHMSQIPVATFDPIFWLHHCNIDRIWAIWQALNPDKWFTEGRLGNFDQKTIGLPEVITNKTPLRPFHKDVHGTTWTSDEVRDHFQFGYSYPELQRWLPEYRSSDGNLSSGSYQNKIFETVNVKYGACRQQALQMLAQAQAGTSPLPGGMTEAGTGVSALDYAISVRYSKFAFGGHPFNIEICLDPGDGSPRDYKRDYVTNVYNFSSPAVVNGEEVCTNCTNLQGQDIQVSSYAPITPILNRLHKQQRLNSLKKEDVEGELQRLYWNITMNGRPVPVSEWSRLGLKIILSSSEVTHSHDPTVVSDFGNFDVIPSIGVGATPPGVDAYYLPYDQSIKLKTEVGTGGSVVFQSSYLSLTAGNRTDSTGISLLYFDESSGQDPNDEENYQFLFTFSIRRRERTIWLNSKPAHGGWHNQTVIPLDGWFQGSNVRIRVDVRQNDYAVFIDGRSFRTRNKNLGQLNVTHVQYWSYPESIPPALSPRAISVTTYRSSNEVPAG